MASANMEESQNPKPLAECIAGMPPRQLAPFVGIPLVSGAPSAISSASSTRADPICFGSFEFAPHEPALQPVFADLSNSMELAFGCFRYSKNAEGTLRYPGQIQPGPMASAATSVASSASAPVRVVQIVSTSTLASASAPASPARSTSTPAPPSMSIIKSTSASSIASASKSSSSLQSPEPTSSPAILSPSASCKDIMTYSTPSE